MAHFFVIIICIKQPLSLTKPTRIMKKAFLTISAYSLSLLMSVSFFLFLFQIFAFNHFIGIGIVLLLILTSVILITDKDFIQEAE